MAAARKGRTVLVAIDGKAHSDKVVDFAMDYAKTRGDKVLLAYSITRTSIREGVAEEYRDDKGFIEEERYYKDEFESASAKAINKLAKAGIPCEGVWGYGDPAKFILSLAKERNAGVIVVGIHGLRNVGKLRALREVARNVIEGSNVPVVAVP